MASRFIFVLSYYFDDTGKVECARSSVIGIKKSQINSKLFFDEGKINYFNS